MTRRNGSTHDPAALGDPAIDRRSLLRGTAALSACLATPATAASLAAAPASRPIRFVVIDSRIGASAEFGRQMSRFGAEALDVSEGLTALWQDRLVPHWHASEAIVAGLTTRSIWDGLSQQALGQFRKPRLLGDHRFDSATGGLHHALDLPASMRAEAHASLLDAAAWPAAMALLVRDCAASSQARRQSCDVRQQGRRIPSPDQLISWMVV